MNYSYKKGAKNNLKKYGAIGILILILGMLFLPVKSLAEENNIKSKGSMEGMIQFYAQDIHYLKTEIFMLLAECEG